MHMTVFCVLTVLGVDKIFFRAYNKYIKEKISIGKGNERKSSSEDCIRDGMPQAESIPCNDLCEVHPGADMVMLRLSRAR